MVNQEILNYVIIRKLGEGAMGQVFLAKNKSIHQFVAIKMLHPQYSGNPTLRDRFRQEAIMLSSLNHPNIVKFLNYVENEQGIFLIMEYVDGMTLEDYINKKNGLIVESRAYPMMRQILEAFSYAHGRGIVHRDIKPGNIFIAKDGNIKILDFGIAQILSESNDRTLTGQGTVAYMSPEQALDRPLDIRSDIYSLGVVFYQMLTGRSPYNIDGLSSFDIKKSIIEEPLPPMRKIYPYISDGMQLVVDRATAKDPERRFKTTGEMLSLVMRVKKINEDAESGKSTKTKNVTPVQNTGNAKTGKLPKKKQTGTLVLWSCVAAVLLLALGGAAYWMWMRDTTKFYLDYAEKWEQPEGIDKISESELANLPMVYKIQYEGGRVKRVTLVGKDGKPIAVPDSLLALVRYSDIELVYGADGKVSAKHVYDETGKKLLTINLTDGQSRARLDYADADSVARPSVNYRLRHNAGTGYRETALMVNESDSLVCDADSVYGYEYAYDGKGRINRLTYLGNDKKARTNNYGVAYVGYDFDMNGFLLKSDTYDAKGKPVVPELKVAKAKMSAAPGVGKTQSKKKKNRVNPYDPGPGDSQSGNNTGSMKERFGIR